MDNNTLQLKIKQRLNKLASFDFDNLECWQMIEAFNKAQVSWCRRQLHGTNTCNMYLFQLILKIQMKVL